MFKFLFQQWIKGFCIFGMRMADVDLSSGTVKSNINGFVTAVNVVDFSVNNATAADVIQIIQIPAGATLIAAGSVVLTAEAATATATLGIDGAADAIDASVDFNGAQYLNTGMLEADTWGATVGHYFSAADTIDYVLEHDMDTAKILTWVQWVQYDNDNQKA